MGPAYDILLAVALLAGIAAVMYAGLRLAGRCQPPQVTAEPRCRQCGYIVVGLPVPRCPECGANLTRRNAVIILSNRLRMGLRQVAWFGSVAAIGFALLGPLERWCNRMLKPFHLERHEQSIVYNSMATSASAEQWPFQVTFECEGYTPCPPPRSVIIVDLRSGSHYRADLTRGNAHYSVDGQLGPPVPINPQTLARPFASAGLTDQSPQIQSLYRLISDVREKGHVALPADDMICGYPASVRGSNVCHQVSSPGSILISCLVIGWLIGSNWLYRHARRMGWKVGQTTLRYRTR